MAFIDPVDVMIELREILVADADLNAMTIQVESGVQNVAEMPFITIVYAGMVLDDQGLGAGTGAFNSTLNIDVTVYDFNLGEPLAARRETSRHAKVLRGVIHKAANRNIGGKVLSSTITESSPVNESVEGAHVAGERMRLECLIRETS